MPKRRGEKGTVPAPYRCTFSSISPGANRWQKFRSSFDNAGRRTIDIARVVASRVERVGKRELISTRGVLIFQSGGPTTVLNASLAGAIRAARNAGYDRIFGARRGVEGILAESFIDLTGLDEDRLERLTRTPSAALGTTRLRPDDGQVACVLEILQRHDIEAVVGIGGNDTADTSYRLAQLARQRNAGVRFVNVPKTIDNDLFGTDHALGYGSAARFIALAVRDAAFDTYAMADIYPIKIVEVMGRNAGWLAASGTLAFDASMVPPIVCLPERPLESLDSLVAIVASRIDATGSAVLVVPETMRWASGEHVAGGTPQWVDTFGHPYYGGAGSMLAHALASALHVRARYDKPGTISRMAMHAVSEVDLSEAVESGREAVHRLVDGETGVMVSIVRESDDPYKVRYGTVELEQVANVERRMPDVMIDESGIGLTEQFRAHALPLLGAPIEKYEVLH